jgi:hypothetical protein
MPNQENRELAERQPVPTPEADKLKEVGPIYHEGDVEDGGDGNQYKTDGQGRWKKVPKSDGWL